MHYPWKRRLTIWTLLKLKTFIHQNTQESEKASKRREKILFAMYISDKKLLFKILTPINQ